jgi:hypothetical protein
MYFCTDGVFCLVHTACACCVLWHANCEDLVCLVFTPETSENGVCVARVFIHDRHDVTGTSAWELEIDGRCGNAAATYRTQLSSANNKRRGHPEHQQLQHHH